MTQTCNNKFLESDGYCTQCGLNHLREADRLIKHRNRNRMTFHGVPAPVDPPPAPPRETKREMLRAEKLASIEANIQNTPVFRAFRDTMFLLADIYNINLTVEFGNMNSGYVTRKNDGSWYCRMGYKILRDDAETGYSDYRADYLVPADRPKGADAGIWTALHEFAHIVDIEKNGRARGKMHPPSWKRAFAELIKVAL